MESTCRWVKSKRRSARLVSSIAAGDMGTAGTARLTKAEGTGSPASGHSHGAGWGRTRMLWYQQV